MGTDMIYILQAIDELVGSSTEPEQLRRIRSIALKAGLTLPRANYFTDWQMVFEGHALETYQNDQLQKNLDRDKGMQKKELSDMCRSVGICP